MPKNARLDLFQPLSILRQQQPHGKFAKIFVKVFGGLAQLVEHLPCKQGVSGSIPLTSTNRLYRKT